MLKPAPAPLARPTVAYRPLERRDLPAAAALFAEHLAPALRGRPGDVAAFLGRSLLDAPWADPDAPSLAAQDAGGRLLGFVGVQVRPARVGARRLRLAWPEHLVVAPEGRTRAVGVGLLREVVAGPQDATVADTASPMVERMLLRLGATRLELKAVHWVRVLRPCGVAARVVPVRRARARAALVRAAPALDRLCARPLRVEAPPGVRAEPLDAGAWAEHAAQVLAPGTLHVAYDERSLAWQLEEIARVPRRGRVVAHLVRAADGRALGWYVYLLRPGWRSEVLQIAARPRHVQAVVDHLLWHAAAGGSAAVRGRLEPGLLEAVVARRCLLWHRGGALVHTRDDALLAAVHAEGALLTRLEGDWLADAVV